MWGGIFWLASDPKKAHRDWSCQSQLSFVMKCSRACGLNCCLGNCTFDFPISSTFLPVYLKIKKWGCVTRVTQMWGLCVIWEVTECSIFWLPHPSHEKAEPCLCLTVMEGMSCWLKPASSGFINLTVKASSSLTYLSTCRLSSQNNQSWLFISEVMKNINVQV